MYMKIHAQLCMHELSTLDENRNKSKEIKFGTNITVTEKIKI